MCFNNTCFTKTGGGSDLVSRAILILVIRLTAKGNHLLEGCMCFYFSIFSGKQEARSLSNRGWYIFGETEVCHSHFEDGFGKKICIARLLTLRDHIHLTVKCNINWSALVSVVILLL